MKKKALILALLTAMMVVISGCQSEFENMDENLNTTGGKLIITLTDGPFPIDMIDSAIVTIVKVEIRNQNESDSSSFLTLMEDTLRFNLLELRNGVTAELLETDIPEGNYDLIRLYVDEANLTVKEGDTYSMKVPSGSQTGIKLFIKPALRISGGTVTEVLLDFDLERSFVLKGNLKTPAGIKGFNFKPVIRAVNNVTTGSIEGMVSDTAGLALANASAWIEKDSVIATAYSDSTGYYGIIGIPADLYTLHATKEDYDTVSVEGFEIIEGNIIQQDFTLTPIGEGN